MKPLRTCSTQSRNSAIGCCREKTPRAPERNALMTASCTVSLRQDDDGDPGIGAADGVGQVESAA